VQLQITDNNGKFITLRFEFFMDIVNQESLAYVKVSSKQRRNLQQINARNIPK